VIEWIMNPPQQMQVLRWQIANCAQWESLPRP
jgi:hypothetical protein